jgi:hypothetical protein
VIGIQELLVLMYLTNGCVTNEVALSPVLADEGTIRQSVCYHAPWRGNEEGELAAFCALCFSFLLAGSAI